MATFGGPADWWTDDTDAGRTHIATKGIVQDGLVLNLDAGVDSSYPNSGTTWTDLSGNGYNGILVNGPTFDNGSGGSIVFDGVNDYAYIKTLNYGGGKTISEMSVLIWTKTTVQGSNTGDGSVDNSNWALFDFDRSEVFNIYLEPGGQLKFSGDSSNTGGFTTYYDLGAGTSTVFNDGSYHMVGVTFSVANQEIKFYGDGQLLRTATANGSMTALGAGLKRYGFIGDGSEADSENSTRNNFHYEGYISSILFYDNKVLTDREILQNYNATKGRFGLT